MTHGAQGAHALVSIIMPVFNDAEWVSRALQSCIDQTHGAIEVIVVDDASTDNTVEIVNEFAQSDPRIILISLENNLSALTARRVGIDAAHGEYIMFLDGDDELVSTACETVVSKAHETRADLVGFGSLVVSPDGSTGSHYENSMQPKHTELFGTDVLESLFPVGQNAQGQLWRYLFKRSILVRAYASLPQDLVLPRMNDLPVAFLAAMHAKHYVSVKNRLYRYFFRRGASGHDISSWSDYLFNENSMASIDSIEDSVQAESDTRGADERLLALYKSVRSSVIGRVLNYIYGIKDDQMRSEALDHLIARVGGLATVIASSDFCPRVLPMLTEAIRPPKQSSSTPRHVVLRTGNLRTGGVQGVVVAQAAHLARAGLKVTIVLDSEPNSAYSLPHDVELLSLEGSTRGERIGFLAGLCLEQEVDAVIDHHIFYNDRWPYFALGLASTGVPTLGWIHNFALRPLLDEVSRLSFLDRYLPTLQTVVVLSEPDVTYWKLRGLPNVVYLPNPPSPLVNQIQVAGHPRLPRSEGATFEIVWWGRLQQKTKQVLDLVDIAVELREKGVDFHIKIVGPDGPDLDRGRIRKRAKDRRVSDHISLLGALHGKELIDAVQNSHVFISTSIVEGYPLALVEAQALGLPIVMYDLPWLEFLQNNTGSITVPQGDRNAIAGALAELASDASRYSNMSAGALEAVHRERSHDLQALYVALLSGELDQQYSPAPSFNSMQLILSQNIRFVERLDRIHRREVKRMDLELGRTIKRSQEQQKRAPISVKSGSKRPAPMVPRVRAFLQRFLPATMRQAAYYARHEYSVSNDQYMQIISNQEALSRQLSKLEHQVSPKSR